jgi:hypothetical protein
MPDFGIMRGFNDKLFGDKLYAGQLPTELGLIGSQDIGSLLLDFYPNSAAAYSLRKLRLLYTGNAIRVRRSSDNTEQNIGFTALGDLDTTSLTSFCSGTNGFVTTWYDQSGNSNNATQSTANIQPQIVSNGSVTNDGVKNALLWKNVGNDNLLLTRISNARSVFQSGKIEQLNDFIQCVLGDSVFNEYHGGLQTMLLDNPLTDNTQNGVNKINGSTVNLRTFTRNTNRNLISMIHAASTNRTDQIAQNAFPAQRSWRGYINEIIIYSTDQTTNRSGIESNINTYYAIY